MKLYTIAVGSREASRKCESGSTMTSSDDTRRKPKPRGKSRWSKRGRPGRNKLILIVDIVDPFPPDREREQGGLLSSIRLLQVLARSHGWPHSYEVDAVTILDESQHEALYGALKARLARNPRPISGDKAEMVRDLVERMAPPPSQRRAKRRTASGDPPEE